MVEKIKEVENFFFLKKVEKLKVKSFSNPRA